MSAREIMLALFLATGACLVVWGVSMISLPAAAISAGVLTAALGFVFLFEANG